MFLKIYGKEMKDCFRDRRTLLLSVLLPIIMMTGLVFFYEKLVSNHGDETYTLAVSEDFSQEEEELFKGYGEIEFVRSSKLKEKVKQGEAIAAIELSANFINTIEGGGEATVTIIGDSFSQQSSNLMTLLTNALAVYEKSVIWDRLQAQDIELSLVQPFTIEHKEVMDGDPNINLIALLIPMILGAAIAVGAGPAASDLFAGEKERKTMEALLITPVKRSSLLFAKWLTITSIGALAGIITLIVVSVEIAFFTENLKGAVAFGDKAVLIIGLAIVFSIIYSMFNASLLMITSIAAKTVKESQSYSSPVMMLSIFPMLILSGVGINELSFQYFAVPMINLYAILKELIFGIVNYEHIVITIVSNLIFMIVALVAARILFMKDKWVMN
ncbi:ABC transporter permease [Psychrobacillus glaciei]|uniref:ABC transporter permease n=1 Tax=Psychrobacillus glaciei TaxID=2283160 RepID=A0A5J6SRZ9_9BACI|nr:ABC transporter permease subunit [Psychrobacillus glaciei]QFG00757.1 ABC transporter permease [Psychrobacillus glaciei]